MQRKSRRIFQFALLRRSLLPGIRPAWPMGQRPSRLLPCLRHEIKRPTFSSLKTAPGIEKVGLCDFSDGFPCRQGVPRPHIYHLPSPYGGYQAPGPVPPGGVVAPADHTAVVPVPMAMIDINIQKTIKMALITIKNEKIMTKTC